MTTKTIQFLPIEIVEGKATKGGKQGYTFVSNKLTTTDGEVFGVFSNSDRTLYLTLEPASKPVGVDPEKERMRQELELLKAQMSQLLAMKREAVLVTADGGSKPSVVKNGKHA